MRDIWEIVDRDDPRRAGPRFATLLRASQHLERVEPAERFYIRLVEEVRPSD